MDNINETVVMTVISVPGEKVQTLRAEFQAEDADHRNIVADLQEQIAVLKEKNNSLNRHLAEMYEDQNAASQRVVELHAKISNMEKELREYKSNDPNLEAKAIAYMEDKGQHNITDGFVNHIANIKEVRTLTGWHLKETKDFCEEWMLENGFYQETGTFRWLLKQPLAQAQ